MVVSKYLKTVSIELYCVESVRVFHSGLCRADSPRFEPCSVHQLDISKFHPHCISKLPHSIYYSSHNPLAASFFVKEILNQLFLKIMGLLKLAWKYSTH